MLFFFAPALADVPDDGAVQALASKAIGKDVPARFLCIERPDLGEPFSGDPVPVGIKVKNQGCKLRGIIVAGTWQQPETALITAVPGWAALSSDARGEAAVKWSRDVLLAFEQPVGAVEWNGSAVTARVASRIPKPQHAAESDTKLTFDAAGALTREDTNTSTYQTDMTVRVHSTRGLTEDQLLAGMQSKGLLFEECIRAAWADDLTIQGRTRLSWDIKDGKGSNVTVRGWGETPLLGCYSGVIQRLEFEADGGADLTIAVVRSPVAN